MWKNIKAYFPYFLLVAMNVYGGLLTLKSHQTIWTIVFVINIIVAVLLGFIVQELKYYRRHTEKLDNILWYYLGIHWTDHEKIDNLEQKIEEREKDKS